MPAATQIFSYAVTIPAQTLASAPLTTDVSFPPASVVSIRWRVPPGPSGSMSFAITSDGASVIPTQDGSFITADNESAQWDIAGYQDSGSWQVTGYNTDSFDHTVYLDFLTVPPGQDVTATPTLQTTQTTIDPAQLGSPAPDTSFFTAGVEVQS